MKAERIGSLCRNQFEKSVRLERVVLGEFYPGKDDEFFAEAEALFAALADCVEQFQKERISAGESGLDRIVEQRKFLQIWWVLRAVKAIHTVGDNCAGARMQCHLMASLLDRAYDEKMSRRIGESTASY